MHAITHWPERSDLHIPNKTFHHLMEVLTAPFGDEVAAKEFWEEAGCGLIHMDATDTHERLQFADQEMQRQIEFAFTYPEEVQRLDGDFVLILAITSDSGGGVYLLIHPDCPLLEGWTNA